MDFVHDFNLEFTEPGVCFNALIGFNLPMHHFNLMSEVQVDAVMSGDIDTICLLNPALDAYNIPTLFNDLSHRLAYIKNRALLVFGLLPLYGAFTIAIIPKSRYCALKTYDELRAKKLN
jgi:hypothetical protein